jgi:hypothetical protein
MEMVSQKTKKINGEGIVLKKMEKEWKTAASNKGQTRPSSSSCLSFSYLHPKTLVALLVPSVCIKLVLSCLESLPISVNFLIQLSRDITIGNKSLQQHPPPPSKKIQPKRILQWVR